MIDSSSGNTVVFSGQSQKEDGVVTGAGRGDSQNPGRRCLQPYCRFPFQSLVEESNVDGEKKVSLEGFPSLKSKKFLSSWAGVSLTSRTKRDG